MSILEEYKIFHTLSGELKCAVEWYHVLISVLNSSVGEYIDHKPFAFVGTEDDRVFSYGHNQLALLGLGHDDQVDRWTEVEQLRGQHIEQIYQGMTHMVAKNREDRIFTWGYNTVGQLGHSGVVRSVPVKIAYFDDKGIKMVSVGDCHNLALSAQGDLHAWGWNYQGQLACPKNELVAPVYDIVASPFQLFTECNTKFKSIYAYSNCSFAITMDDHVYVWGSNMKKQLGLDEQGVFYSPQIIKLNNVGKITHSFDLTFFITDQGDVYKCGQDPVTNMDKFRQDYFNKSIDNIWNYSEIVLVGFELIESDVNFTDAHHNKFISDQGIFIYRENENHFEKSKFINMVDHYLNEFESTPKTIHLDQQGNLMTKVCQYTLSDDIILRESFRIIYENNSHLNAFKIIKTIGFGGFGKVLLVEHKETRRKFALKKIWIETSGKSEKNELFREIRTLCQLNSDFVVQLTDAWIDVRKGFLYIQMDYCEQSLSDLIDHKCRTFGRQSGEPMKCLEFFVTINLLIDINQCVNHMHTPRKRHWDNMISDIPEQMHDYNVILKDPRTNHLTSLIHRDLKPANILVSSAGYNDKFIKLCDFGLSKISDGYERSQAGTDHYMAPEVRDGKYNLKADIYSVGIIARELFDIQSPDDFIKYQGSSLEIHMSIVLDIIERMTKIDFEQRPDCKELLHVYDTCKIHLGDILNEENKQVLTEFVHQDNFLLEYIKSKLTLVRIRCDGCQVTLFDLRERLLRTGYHCQECPDFDLCADCHQDSDHKENHQMVEHKYQDYSEILLHEQIEDPIISSAPSPRLCKIIKFREPGIETGITTNSNKFTNVHRVQHILPGSPAHSAGLMVGDRIVEINMVNVDKDDYQAFFKRCNEPDRVDVLVMDRETERWYSKRKIVAKNWHSNVVHIETDVRLFQK